MAGALVTDVAEVVLSLDSEQIGSFRERNLAEKIIGPFERPATAYELFNAPSNLLRGVQCLEGGLPYSICFYCHPGLEHPSMTVAGDKITFGAKGVVFPSDRQIQVYIQELEKLGTSASHLWLEITKKIDSDVLYQGSEEYPQRGDKQIYYASSAVQLGKPDVGEGYVLQMATTGYDRQKQAQLHAWFLRRVNAELAN